MATSKDQETLRLLVQHVARSFYEPKFVVILDQLVRHPVLKDDDLAGRIGLQAKELNKLMAVLTNDRLVQVHRQNELKDGAQRSIGKQYYYVDYQHFCNVVKWRVAEMHRLINSTIKNELVNKGYICPNCKATYSPLEADRVMSFALGTFVCDQCTTSPGAPHELVLNEDAESVRGSKDRMERFNKQTQFIREGLRKSESMTLPAFDIAIWVKNHVSDADKQKQGQNGNGLKVAGSDGKRQEESIGIVLSVDKDEATRRQEREAEAEAKRQQNVLPSWHLKSTISNDLTALGVAAVTQANGSGNDAILSSLGDGLSKVKKPSKPNQPVPTSPQDVKPTIDHNADFYEQYYANLEANSRSQSVLQTPVTESLGNDFDDGAKSNGPYLDSLNPSGKRSRSREEDDERFAKAQRSNAGTPAFSRSPSALMSAVDSPSPFPDSGLGRSDGEVNGGGEPMDTDVSAQQQPADDPMVLVGGQPMPFSQVTQEIADEKMSAEEYTAWYELLMAQG